MTTGLDAITEVAWANAQCLARIKGHIEPSTVVQALKLAEEGGEVAKAIIKQQGTAALTGELADVILVACSVAGSLGLTIDAVIDQKLADARALIDAPSTPPIS